MTPARIDRARLRSQRLREANFQGDAHLLGMNWTEDDLAKPQVVVESDALGHPHDAMVLISGNDKSVPAHLLAMARRDLPAVHTGQSPLSPVNAGDLAEARWSRSR